MVDKNIIQSRFTKLGVVPIDNQHYLYATLDNNLTGIIVVIKTCDKHYYDEDNLDIGKPIQCNVVVNHTIELTDKEKAEARRNAIQRATNEAYAKITRRNSPKKNQETQSDTLTLF